MIKLPELPKRNYRGYEQLASILAQQFRHRELPQYRCFDKVSCKPIALRRLRNGEKQSMIIKHQQPVSCKVGLSPRFEGDHRVYKHGSI